jgi:transposase-like protein
LIVTKRNRTSAKDIGYGLYLYFLGLSYRNTAKALSRFVKRSHVAVWKWIQKYKPERILYRRRKVSELVIDETQIKVGNNYFWLWIAIELNNKSILDIYISAEKETYLLHRILFEIW